MPTVSINLPPDLNSLVERKVVSGQFHSAEAVLCEGLRLLQEREEFSRPDFMVSTMEELEQKLVEAAESLARGEGIPGEESFRRAKEQFRKSRGNG